MIRVALLCLAFLPIESVASAHTRSTSYSSWELAGDKINVVLQVAKIDATSVRDPNPSSYFERSLLLFTESGPCAPLEDTLRTLRAPEGAIRVQWSLFCDGAPTRVQSELFLELPNHLHFATLPWVSAAPLLLSRANPAAELSQTAASTPTALRFVQSGVFHILSGWDHVLFVLLLLFAASNIRQVFTLVTGFTIGHSLSLAAVALGAIDVESRSVECIIAVSIVCLAVENVWSAQRFSPRSLSAIVAAAIAIVGFFAQVPSLVGVGLFVFCYFELLARRPDLFSLKAVFAALFGLFHGFGFAALLSHGDQNVTLGRLFSFNMGVELGQLGLVLLAWLFSRNHREIAVAISAAVGVAVGCWALILRAFGA